MYAPTLRLCLAITLLLIFFSGPLAAKDVDQLDWTGLKEEWGQLLFCQRIYKMPEVESRLYSFDNEQCDKSATLITGVARRYSELEQAKLKNQAEQHAVLLIRNTSEPYHSVGACRAFCSELAEIQDQRSVR